MTKRKLIEDSFKNVVSQRFYSYFIDMIDKGETDYETIGAAIGKNKKHMYTFFNNLKSGHMSVTIEQLLAIKEAYKINPSFFFTGKYQSEAIESYVEEDEIEYVSIGSKAVGEKIRELLNKHDVKPKDYAEQIGMSEGNFQKILRGDVRPYFDLVVRVCDDFGESLDQFRTRPLPKGHILTQLKAQENLIRAHEKRIKELESELQGKRASA